jgi:2-oxoisovalerate dehydrogenase E2 component (dihydrolipoyl transacylase)
MSRYVFKMPDLGEGTVEAEIVSCYVKPGDYVQEEQLILEVMTEKAAVEVPSPVTGRIVSIAGGPGQSVAVGADLIVFDTDTPAASDAAPSQQAELPNATAPSQAEHAAEVVTSARVMASPSTRRRAKEAGVDLTEVSGSGPGGRIQKSDLDDFLAAGSTPDAATKVATAAAPMGETEDVPITGVRRVIAQRMTEAMSIPHFSYIEEVDVTELEALREYLNERQPQGAPAFTYLPFLALALAKVLPAFPQCNAHFDKARNVLVRHRSLHLGIATQTPDGLKVPVVRNVQALSLREIAAEIRRVSEAARTNKAKRAELSASTFTLTSLGKLGGVATTPIINSPEVAILGVNKAIERPVVRQGVIAVRRIMNLSASFDHRFVDGHDAASLLQALKDHLEHPALMALETR